ncbi:MAG: Gfo/Idh/MocA family oxidoreductase [Bacteroides sp.]|nr:Gfo/Idh/MocA family oxidoreductase [Bacteroides sp.]
MEKIKTGLAAFGMSGKIFHAPFIVNNPNFELTTIVERSKTLSKEEYPKATIVKSFDELIQDPDLELIVVNTPNNTHYEFCKKALLANKHVVVEKPFTTNIEEGNELLSIAKKQNKMLSVYQNRRWDSNFLTTKEIIDKGLIGKIVEFEATIPRFRNYVKPNSWKEETDSNGGLIYDLGAHLIDHALQLFGMPEAVYADTGKFRENTQNEDYFIIHLINSEKNPDVKITLKASYLMLEPEPQFLVHGMNGSYIVYSFDRQESDLNKGLRPNNPNWGVMDKKDWGFLHIEKDGVATREPYPSKRGNYGEFYQNIYEHLRLNKPLLTDANEVHKMTHVIEAAYRSANEKKVITL